jgi:hypothetical protein
MAFGMAGATASGRSYMDPNRAQERYNRWGDRQLRQQMAGGAGRGYGGGGGYGARDDNPLRKPITSWYEAVTKRPSFTQQGLTDMATLNRASAPNALPGVAEAQARVQGGIGTVGDYGMLTRQENPRGMPQAQQALARIRFNEQQGLLGAVQRSFYG